MCSKPDFDLKNLDSIAEGLSAASWTDMQDIEQEKFKAVWRNKAITDTYEPGSVFKAITAAAGLEEGVITPNSMVDDYTVDVDGHKINCLKPNAHGEQTFSQSVYNSCNPPFVKIAQDIGIEKFYNYIDKFGFYDLTGIELSGESKSQIHKKPTEIDMAVASFGQRFNVTPIQILSAYGAIANGGNLVKPQIIKKVSNSKGNTIKEFEPLVVRKVISEQTSKTLREILEGAVSQGTGKNAYVQGYKIAGKTGTSETTVAGRYVASFAGFAPYDNPKVACIVIMDNPKGDSYSGGVVAAPAASEIIKQSLDYIGKSK
jgi:stage V sporulation protein D (sporulation-specific penicillin-binding protein)